MKTSMRIAAGLLAALPAVPALALTNVWSSGTGQTWLTPGNWSPGNIPTATDIAAFTNTGSQTFIQINMNTATGLWVVGSVQMMAGSTNNRIIENNSPASSGVLRVMGLGGLLVSNGSSSAMLGFRSGSTNMAVQLGNSGEIFVNSGAGVVISTRPAGRT